MWWGGRRRWWVRGCAGGEGGEEGRGLVHADQRWTVRVFEGGRVEQVVERGTWTWEGGADGF